MYKKAFTLIELVVILGIIAILMGISISSVINYRNYIQLESSYTDMVTSLKGVQNQSVNSTIQPALGTKAPYAYAFYFDSGAYRPYYCEKASDNPLRLACQLDNSFRIAQLANVNDVTIVSTCPGIGFVKLSSDIVSIDQTAFTAGNGIVSSTGTCRITLTHNVSGTSKSINLDLISNNITV